MSTGKMQIEDMYPMSDIQKGMVFLTLKNPTAAVYHDQFTYYVPRVRDHERFAKALELMMDIHPILRTGFDLENYNQQIQIVYKQVAPILTFENLIHLVGDTQEEYIRDFMLHDRNKPYNFKVAPLWRINIFDLDDTNSLYLIQFHHSILDGWSMASFNTQLFNVYSELLNDSSYRPFALKASVKDAIVEEIAERNNKKTIQFWKEKLEDYNKLNIFKDEPIFYEYRKRFDPETTKRLKNDVAAHGLTYKNVIYGSFAYTLRMLSLEDDFVCGIVSNTRPVMQDGDKVLGCFLNTLPMRLAFKDYENLTWFEYFKVIEEDMRILKTKDRSTLYEISKISGRKMGAENPFFDILFNHVDFYNVYKNLSISTAEAKSMKKQKNVKLRSYEATNTFLDLNLVDIPDGSIELHYKLTRELMPGYSLERIQEYLEQIVATYINAPETKMTATGFLPATERDLIFNKFNATEVSYETGKTVLDLFKESVTEYPDHTAVSFADENVSYRELDNKSSQLAHYLHRQYSVGLNDLVGIKLDRSAEMLVAILGILKAGAAYVPIDTSYPEERIEYIKTDSNFKVCIDDAFFDIFSKTKDDQHLLSTKVTVTSDTAAYAIYTSGSTGNPKGVLNNHAGLYNRLLWMRDDLGINAQGIILQKTPYTFDVSVWELLMPSITGCKLVFAKPEGHKDPAYLQELIAREEITILHFVPSMLGIFLENLDPEKCHSLKHVVCSGEALSSILVEEFKLKLPWVRIHNLYGPTEAAIDVTAIELTDVDTKEIGVSIGKPVANTKIYIVDKNLNPQPIGVPGELLIEGIQVARGYLNQPALTAEKFIDSPFNPGYRIYRTGDLAKWLPNGEIAYVGRMDNQVKIRGNRIELGEIETRILKSGYIDQVAVLVKGESSSRKYLVAYIAPKKDYSEELLFNYLKTQLPEYMLPARVIEMTEFPLTSSGKLNRKALPIPNEEDLTATTYEAPRNEMEVALTELWKGVLELKQVGIRDNFFRIGGDSILSIRLISRVNKQFNVSLTIARLYDLNTIARLSEFITNGSSISTEEEIVRKRITAGVDQLKQSILEDLKNREDVEDVYPMRDIQKGMILLSSISPVAGMYHDQFVYQTPKVDVVLFNRSFAKLVEKHEALRTYFDLTTYKEEIQVVKKIIEFDIEQADIQSLTQEQQEEFIRDFMVAERRAPFDTRKAPLWRVNLFTTSSTTGILLFQFHHSILDGWSVASLYTELFQIYKELAVNQNYHPAALKSSNKQAAVEELFEKNSQQNSEFWKNELKDYQRLNIFEKTQVYKLYTEDYTASFRQGLLNRCTEDQVSLKSVVYGAFIYIMKVISNENDFVVGSVSNNRPIMEDGDKILGCFLNTTPVRNNLGDIDKLTWSRYFKRVEEKFISLKSMERTTLYHITKIVNEGAADSSPFFDVLYNYTDFHIYNSLSFNREDSSGKRKANRLSVDNYESTNTALDLSVNVIGNRLSFAYTLTRELKLDITLDKIHECVEQVLTTYINSPHKKTMEMDIVSENEKQRILYTFNDTQKSYPGEVTVVDLFQEQVIKTPDHTAVVAFDGQRITYKELDNQSNQLAHFLLAQGLSKGELVPVYLSRSPEMIISILGILKAGGAYLPIDTGNPSERINYMLEDSAARFVVSDSAFASLFDINKVTPLFIDSISYQDISADQTNIASNSEDIVYVIYTSGSTGKPKGVLVNQGAVASRLRFYKNYYRLDEGDRILFYSSFGFDGTIEEYLLPLTTGAQCIVAGSAFKNDLFANMIDVIEEFKITKVFMTPVVLQNFIEALPHNQVHRVKSLRHVVAGGDKLNAETVNSFYSKIGTVIQGSLYNAYGPTENTNDSAIFKLDGYITGKNIPIGKPVENSGIYILDNHGRLLPVGFTGEICVSGSGLATGYLNKPELTTEKFVPNPFKEGERMYRTGDLGYWLPDGNVTFSGRIDNQVKIRGYRIELGEIEAWILQFGYVENAVVLITEDSETRKYLVAYVIPREGYQQAELYSYLKAQLPDYMLPGMIIEMEIFPVNINGKLDVKALPAPDERLQITNEYLAPTNETEEKLVTIWQQLLGLSRVGIQHNFFQIGGDSLTVLKLRQRIEEELKIEINVVDLFNYTTIQEFATYIIQNQQSEASTENNTVAETLKF